MRYTESSYSLNTCVFSVQCYRRNYAEFLFREKKKTATEQDPVVVDPSYASRLSRMRPYSITITSFVIFFKELPQHWAGRAGNYDNCFVSGPYDFRYIKDRVCVLPLPRNLEELKLRSKKL